MEQPSSFIIHEVTLHDDLDKICQQMQPDQWAKDNDMSSYKLTDLRAFLEKDGLLLLVYKNETIVGAAMGYRLMHPSGEHHLYIHELDAHPDFRGQGVGTMLMNEAFAIGKQEGVHEVWLATETDNDAANGLYTKLSPTEIEKSVTYSYEMSKR